MERKTFFSFFSITDEPFTITPGAFIKDQFWFHVSTSSNSASRYFHPLHIPVHPSENEVMPAAVSHTEIPDPFSISAAFNASYLICTSSSFQKKWHIISLDQPQSTSSISSRVVYPRKNLREWKNETRNGKKLFIEAANIIFPQMFLCCYINSPPYARDHRPGVMARNKECCLSNGGAEKVIEGQTVSGTLEGQ